MVGYQQTNQKTDTGKTLTRWLVLVDHNSTEVSDEQYERFLGHSTSKQAEQILRGEQPAKGLQYAKRAKKLASERKATIDLDNEHLSEIEKYR